ncbi:hypothetical protein [Aminobacter aminovorans]|uniref:Uncharacterized protein n=1 Tax=Aminobacter aminovorans TaxID=83263 RepID=A0ABR6H528_AMIAI|nr:hypothetical protein [Aminobacter aminovorans]MBB3705619.1 hypothetical protein [Aminobacter aminovorans]WMC98210.1 hypothetical protein RAR13_05755 [Aminobacter aminovorans]
MPQPAKAHFDKDFTPANTADSATRTAAAAEFTAYHIGKISKNRERIAEKLDRS